MTIETYEKLTQRMINLGLFDEVVVVGLEDMLETCMEEIRYLNKSYPLKDHKVRDLQQNIIDARYLVGSLRVFSVDKYTEYDVEINQAEDRLKAYLGILEF